MIAARVAAASEPQATTTASLSSGSSSTTSTTGKLLTGLASWLSPSEASEEDTGQVVCRYLGAPAGDLAVGGGGLLLPLQAVGPQFGDGHRPVDGMLCYHGCYSRCCLPGEGSTPLYLPAHLQGVGIVIPMPSVKPQTLVQRQQSLAADQKGLPFLGRVRTSKKSRGCKRSRKCVNNSH